MIRGQNRIPLREVRQASMVSRESPDNGADASHWLQRSRGSLTLRSTLTQNANLVNETASESRHSGRNSVLSQDS